MRSERISDLCIGRWESILTSLGVATEYLSKKHGPCPICGGKDRYKFDNKDGRGTWFCSKCGAGDGFNLVQKMNGWVFSQAATEIERVLGVSQPDVPRREVTDAQKSEALRKAWRESKPVTKGDPVWQYLVNRADICEVPTSLRYHPELRYDANRSFPAMLGVVTMPDGTSSTMHRTWLDGNGGKAQVDEPKKVMSGTIKTGSIRLAEVSEYVGISEGIETALRASILFGVPTWAAISAGGMRDWIAPEGIKHVTIFGDNDANFTGQNAAFALAHTLSMQGIKVEVRIPDQVGTDWADQ